MPEEDNSGRRLNVDLAESIGFLIADAGRFVKRSLYVRISEHGLRGGCWFALRALWQQDAITQRELSYRLGLMAPSVLEMVRTMERDGLVRCERDATDRRKVRIYLTAKARQLERKMMTIANRVNGIMLRGLSIEEEIQLKLLLRRICSTLSGDFGTYLEAQGKKARPAITTRDAQVDAITNHAAAAPKKKRPARRPSATSKRA
jgi:DNA-binding MarR family transcriptional regulator